MPREDSRSYWARSNTVPSLPKFDRLVLIGLIVVGGVATFSNDGHSNNKAVSAKTPTVLLSGALHPGQQHCGGDIAVAGGCVRIAMTAFGPNTRGDYLFDDEQMQPPALLSIDNKRSAASR